MNAVEIILILLAAAVALALAAERAGLPYPIVLVLGGAALAFTPGIPRLEVEPEIVLVTFLPPLLFSAASLTSWRDFRTDLRSIGMLAIGLVIATTASVAWVAHALIPEMPWSIAFVLGAIVSPPDAVAATSVMQRLRVPARLVTILEGESLVNDATGLAAYQVALAAVAGETFSLSHAAGQLAFLAIGGAVFGLLVGWVVALVHRRLDDSVLEVTITLLTPYVAYIPAEHLGFSGVLAVVSAGGYLGWNNPTLFSPLTRLRRASVWSTVLFLFNGLVFIMMGLELAGSHRLLATLPLSGLIEWCVAIGVTTIVVRLLWVPIALQLPYWLSARIRRREHRPAWKESVVMGWTAMRGIVSLALVLALPDTLADGTPFPFRDLLILVVFAVIALTLLGQGLTLPWVIRMLKFVDDGSSHWQERHALIVGNARALARLQELSAAGALEPRIVGLLRTIYERRRERLQASVNDDPSWVKMGADIESYRQLREELIESERAVFVKLRNDGEMSEEILQHLQQDLDLESLQPLR